MIKETFSQIAIAAASLEDYLEGPRILEHVAS